MRAGAGDFGDRHDAEARLFCVAFLAGCHKPNFFMSTLTGHGRMQCMQRAFRSLRLLGRLVSRLARQLRSGIANDKSLTWSRRLGIGDTVRRRDLSDPRRRQLIAALTVSTGSGAVTIFARASTSPTFVITNFPANGHDGQRVDSAGLLSSAEGIKVVIAAAEAAGGGLVYFPPGVYECGFESIVIRGANINLVGQGARLRNARIVLADSATRTTVSGLHLVDTSGSGASYLLDVRGTHFEFEDVTLEKVPVAGGYQAYVRQQSSFGSFKRLRTRGSNGIFIAGHHHSFVDCHLNAAGRDDAYVLKGGDSAGNYETSNIRIVGGTVRNHTAILSIGSEVGESRPSARGGGVVRNVVVENVVAHRCAHLVFIKPGALTSDYREGLVEHIWVRNCKLFDEDGAMFNMGVRIWAARGATVRHLRFEDCQVFARCDDTPVQGSGIEILLRAIGRPASIHDVHFLNLQVVDAYGGRERGVDDAHGNPLEWGARIEIEDGSTGSIGAIHLDGLQLTGTRTGGVVIGERIAGPVVLTNCVMRQVAMNPRSSIGGGVYALSPVRIRQADIQVHRLYPVGSENLKRVHYDAETVRRHIGSVAAGVSLDLILWVPDKDCYVWKIELVNEDGIPQSNVDYSIFEIRNTRANQLLATTATNASGGAAFVAQSRTSMSTTSLVGNAAYFDRSDRLRLKKINIGEGVATSGMYAVLHYVPFSK